MDQITDTQKIGHSPLAKYRHPENAALTWSGRGRKPQWFADHINAGKDPSALAV